MCLPRVVGLAAKAVLVTPEAFRFNVLACRIFSAYGDNKAKVVVSVGSRRTASSRRRFRRERLSLSRVAEAESALGIVEVIETAPVQVAKTVQHGVDEKLVRHSLPKLCISCLREVPCDTFVANVLEHVAS